MPIYVYQCDKCGHKFEAFDKYTDPMERECPVASHRDGAPGRVEMFEYCGGTARRVPAVASFKFNCSMPTYQKPKT